MKAWPRGQGPGVCLRGCVWCGGACGEHECDRCVVDFDFEMETPPRRRPFTPPAAAAGAGGISHTLAPPPLLGMDVHRPPARVSACRRCASATGATTARTMGLIPSRATRFVPCGSSRRSGTKRVRREIGRGTQGLPGARKGAGESGGGVWTAPNGLRYFTITPRTSVSPFVLLAGRLQRRCSPSPSPLHLRFLLPVRTPPPPPTLLRGDGDQPRRTDRIERGGQACRSINQDVRPISKPTGVS